AARRCRRYGDSCARVAHAHAGGVAEGGGRESVTAQPREGFVDGDGVRLHYVEWGDRERPPILFLHGGSAHARWWDFVVEQLGARFRCLALDLRGHGDSPWPASLDYRLEAHAADVAAVIAALELRR